MRYILTCLLFMYALASTFTQAQLSWSKKSYSPTGNIERADFNGDGRPDLLIFGGPTLSVLLNSGNGTFDSAHVFTMAQPLSNMAFVDFNRDGKIDIVGCDGSGNMIILLGNGDGTLNFSQTLANGCA